MTSESSFYYNCVLILFINNIAPEVAFCASGAIIYK